MIDTFFGQILSKKLIGDRCKSRIGDGCKLEMRDKCGLKITNVPKQISKTFLSYPCSQLCSFLRPPPHF
jgi:hypothetical protein